MSEIKKGVTYYFSKQFHDDTGNASDPTNPEAQYQGPDGVWVDLAAPTKQNDKTGLFGGSLDTSSLTPGHYTLRIAGTVPTDKAVGATWDLYILEYDDTDVYTQAELSRMLLTNKMVEAEDGSYVSVYDDDGTLLGTWTWNESTRTREKLV